MQTNPHTLFLLLGANLGDRVKTLSRACQLIEDRIGTVSKASACYETAPWGLIDQPAFINQVLEIQTADSADGVLAKIQRIEEELGRVRHEKWGARQIDIDILYFDQLVCQSERLTVPHPYLHQRRFTLVPLVELAPDMLHPLLGKTNHTLLDECDDEGEVVKMIG